jgi:CubicO group peptidase (beta-lactamase class C family)
MLRFIRSDLLLLLFFIFFISRLHGQSFLKTADSIRIVCQIPELSYALVSSDSVFEFNTIGYQRNNFKFPAKTSDLFRIGSSTKIVTGNIAALLVRSGKIRWETKFFDLFPELLNSSLQVHKDLTLVDLLTMRTKLYPYTYTYTEPAENQFEGNEEQQRYLFAKWFLAQPARQTADSVNFSNLAYVLAGLMLEKCSGKSYKQLVSEFGSATGVAFWFGQPNNINSLQPWGHNQNLDPEPPGKNIKLEWLLAAGNISVSMPDYIKFAQLQLAGLQGNSPLLLKEQYEFLHFCRSSFAVGWFQANDPLLGPFSWHLGNPGSFLCRTYIFTKKDRAILLFANVQSNKADEGLLILYEMLKDQIDTK